MARYTPSRSTASDANAPPASHLPRKVATTIVLVSLLAVQPAAAQGSAVCSADNLPSMIEGFFQLTTALGIVGLAVVWQADSLIEMFTLSPERKKGVNSPAHGGAGLVSELGLYPQLGGRDESPVRRHYS